MELGKPPSTLEEGVVIATKAAEIFVKHYYSTLDSKLSDRAIQTHSLYSPTSRITWNGNPIPFTDLTTFIERLPISSHEIQAFDCHPITGSSTGAPPSLVVSVTGQVTHGPSAPIPSHSGTVHTRDFDFLPRVFNQSFILVFNPNLNHHLQGNKNGGQYIISADAFRFC